ETVVVAVARRQEIECLAAIDRFECAGVQHVDGVGRFWVRVNLAEIPGPLAKTAILVNSRPFLPGVSRTINPAFLCFDDCIDTVRIRAGNGDADLAENSIGQSISSSLF